MSDRVRPYLFYDVALSVCATCFRKIEAQLLIQDDREWMLTVRDFTNETVAALRSSNPLECVEVQDVGLEEIFKDYVRGRRMLSC